MNTKKLLGRTKRARRNLALKLVLEKRFLPEIKSYFNTITKDFKSLYIATGEKIQPDYYNDETVALLKNQYKRVSNAFSNEMRIAATKKEIQISFYTKQEEDQQNTEDLIEAALVLFVNRSSKERSALLDDTTNKDINDAVFEATQQLEEEGKETNNLTIGLLAAILLKRKFAGRESGIALTETQFSAERTKFIEGVIITDGIEANINDAAAGRARPGTETRKRWASILDEVTRPHHVAADGQTKIIDEPFVVNGELLMHPGDTSMGASANNVINCRCSSLYQA